MALEDFDEAGDEPDLALDPVDLAAAAADKAADLDQDLFDFPPGGVQQTDPTLQTPPPPMFDGPEVPAGPTPAIASDTTGYDPDLDEDLFGFSEIFGGGDVEVPPAAVAEPAPPSAQVPVAAPQPETPPAAPASTKAEAPAAPALQPALAAADESDLIALAESVHGPHAPPAAAAGGPDRLVMVLAAGFLLVNSALILLAWQANNSFHDTLRGVTSSIADGLAHASSPTVQAAPVEYVAVPTSGHEPQSPDLPPSPLESVPRQSIANARLMLSEGRFLDARKNLYRLLANQDLVALERATAAEAEFLIAETYELQGSALAEDGR